MSFEIISTSRAALGESPVWDKDTSTIYWVDIVNKTLFSYDTKQEQRKSIEFPQCISGVALKTDGVAVVTLEDGFYFLDLATEKLQLIEHVEKELVTNRINDGKCDARGRFFAGTMSNLFVDDQAAFYCLHNDLTVEKKVEPISLSNGIAWTKDNLYMYLIDTSKQVVYQFDYNIETSSMTNQKVIIDFHNEEGMPDGMTIDEEDMLWIAHWGGAKISRWNPRTGQKLSELPIPALNITSCIFGGDNLDELYITTALNNMPDEEVQQYPLSGHTLKIAMNVRGLATNRFQE